MNEVNTVNINEIIFDIRLNLKRARLSKEEIENYLIFNYFKSGILKLTDSELLDFQKYCQSLPTYSALKIKKLSLKTIIHKKLSL